VFVHARVAGGSNKLTEPRHFVILRFHESLLFLRFAILVAVV